MRGLQAEGTACAEASGQNLMCLRICRSLRTEWQGVEGELERP